MLKLLEAKFGASSLDYVLVHAELVRVLIKRGKIAAALRLAQRWQGLLSSVYTQKHPDVAYCWQIIGNLYGRLGLHFEALKALHKSIEIYTDPHVLPGQSLQWVLLAIARYTMRSAQNRGQHHAVFEDAPLRQLRRQHGEDHLEWLNVWQEMLLSNAMDRAYLLSSIEEQARLVQRVSLRYGPTQTTALAMQRSLIRMALCANLFDRAIVEQSTYIKLVERLYGSGHMVSSSAKCWLAGLLSARGSAEANQSLLVQSNQIVISVIREDPASEQMCHRRLAKVRHAFDTKLEQE